MNEIKLKVVNKDEFRKILLDAIMQNNKSYTVEDVFEILMDSGFPKLDFDDLSKCLSQIFVYLDPVAVDIGDSRLVWVVSGNRAILINKS